MIQEGGETNEDLGTGHNEDQVEEQASLILQRKVKDTVTIDDLDIVKLSAYIWKSSKDKAKDKKLIASSSFCASMIILTQVYILCMLVLDVPDALFCGDIVR